MSSLNRRNFLRASGLSVIPVFLPASSLLAANRAELPIPAEGPEIEFFSDGKTYSEEEYIACLQRIHAKQPIKRDYYGKGGVVAALEKKFEEITGKEKAIYMPSGTMANQLAIAVLSGENTKIFVQDTSHVYRDEADAAQSVFNKRLMPLAKDETYFTVEQLKEAIGSLRDTEVFASGVGAVSIENPVRRTKERMVPIEEIRKISEYCRANNIKLHLDGARIYMSSAWSGTSVKEYAAHFDTVYISLYKYLGAHAGAILCGDKQTIGKMEHLIKIHGGNQFGNWTNAVVALDRVEGIEQRLQDTIKRWNELMPALNKLNGIKITALNGGTNTYELQLSKEINGTKFQQGLAKDFGIRIARPGTDNKIFLTVNETLLLKEANFVKNAFESMLKNS
jgi:threonine aldolase